MGEAQASPPAPTLPVALQVRRATGPVVGRQVELGAIRQELAAARGGRLTALTLEGEPGIGKTRLLVAAAEVAATEGFTPLAATGDEEIRVRSSSRAGSSPQRPCTRAAPTAHGSSSGGSSTRYRAETTRQSRLSHRITSSFEFLISLPWPSASWLPPAPSQCSSTISSGPTRTACGCSVTSSGQTATCPSSWDSRRGLRDSPSSRRASP